MSYVSTYDQRKPVSKGIVFTIGVHAALAGTYLLIPAHIIEDIIKVPNPTVVTFVEIPVPPPPEPVEKAEVQVATQKPTSEVVTAPTTIVETASFDNSLVVATTGIESVDLGSSVVPVPPVPEPILTDAVRDARFARHFQPPYPTRLRREGVEGIVKISVLIGTDGRVKQVRKISSAHDAFWRVTERRALKRWRFKPATKDGVKIESWKTMRVIFEMDS